MKNLENNQDLSNMQKLRSYQSQGHVVSGKQCSLCASPFWQKPHTSGAATDFCRRQNIQSFFTPQNRTHTTEQPCPSSTSSGLVMVVLAGSCGSAALAVVTPATSPTASTAVRPPFFFFWMSSLCRATRLSLVVWRVDLCLLGFLFYRTGLTWYCCGPCNMGKLWSKTLQQECHIVNHCLPAWISAGTSGFAVFLSFLLPLTG